jgi:hypothetical protein
VSSHELRRQLHSFHGGRSHLIMGRFFVRKTRRAQGNDSSSPADIIRDTLTDETMTWTF